MDFPDTSGLRRGGRGPRGRTAGRRRCRSLAAVLLVLAAAPGASPAASPAERVTLPAREGGAAGGDLLMRRWSVADGLPQSSVVDLAEDDRGRLWLATFGGLARFDGAAFRSFDVASLAGLPSNQITAVVPAGDGALWLATASGTAHHEGDLSCMSPFELLQVLQFLGKSGRLFLRRSPGDEARCRVLPHGLTELECGALRQREAALAFSWWREGSFRFESQPATAAAERGERPGLPPQPLLPRVAGALARPGRPARRRRAR